jgi:exosortase A-associated hydrolase 1
MNAEERAFSIAGPQGDMLGIVSLPPPGTPVQRTAVVVVVGGAQYRVGSHRQFVLLARCLAAAGHPVLRFDLPGMGDSPGEFTPFEATPPHIGAAIDALQTACPGANQVVLWGLCDGASASLLYVQATADPRVAGLALLNPWVRSEASLAKTRVKHYYRQRLLSADFWQKLLRGGVGWPALRSLFGNLARMGGAQAQPQAFQHRMAEGWRSFTGPVLLLLSERDLTAQEFAEYADAQPAWAGWRQKAGVAQQRVAEADHTCSSASAREAVEQGTLRWLRSV